MKKEKEMEREGGTESEIEKIERGSVCDRERERERNRLIRGGRMYVHLIFIL